MDQGDTDSAIYLSAWSQLRSLDVVGAGDRSKPTAATEVKTKSLRNWDGAISDANAL